MTRTCQASEEYRDAQHRVAVACIQCGSVVQMRELLDGWPNILHELRDKKLDPLDIAAQWGQRAMALLIKQIIGEGDWRVGALIDDDRVFPLLRSDSLPCDDSDKRNPSHYAAMGGATRCLRALIQSDFPIDAKDGHGMLPLTYALQNRHDESARMLMQAGSPVTSRDVFVAAKAGLSSDTLRALLRSGCFQNKHDELGSTALHVAAQAGDIKAVSVLLDAGWNIEEPDFDGNTALVRAVPQKDVSLCLLSRGAKLNRRSAAALGMWSEMRTLPIEAKLAHQGSEMHYAAMGGAVLCAQVLLQNGVKTSELAGESGTPLHWACRWGQKAMALWLVEHGCDPKILTGRRRSVLHAAVEGKESEIVRLALTKWGVLTSRDHVGLEPIHYAAEYDVPTAIKMLKGHSVVSWPEQRAELVDRCAAFHGINSAILLLNDWADDLKSKRGQV